MITKAAGSTWYVDDGLCFIDSNTGPNNILHELNELHKNIIKLTMVNENNRT